MRLKTLIIDDEASARSRLRRLLGERPEIELIGEAEDGLEAVARITSLRPDLVFLDVQMPGLSGFEALEALPESSPPPLVIFVTAYDEYALSAFEANAVGYLLKPINRERLHKAVGRAARLCESRADAHAESRRIQNVTKTLLAPPSQLIARRRGRFIILRLDEIFLVQVDDGLVKVKTEGEAYATDYQLNDLEKRLPNPPFFRARREVIVNMQKVKEIAPYFKSTYLIVMNDKEASEIQVSGRQSKQLRQLLQI